jgi:hypothetical protein
VLQWSEAALQDHVAVGPFQPPVVPSNTANSIPASAPSAPPSDVPEALRRGAKPDGCTHASGSTSPDAGPGGFICSQPRLDSQPACVIPSGPPGVLPRRHSSGEEHAAFLLGGVDALKVMDSTWPHERGSGGSHDGAAVSMLARDDDGESAKRARHDSIGVEMECMRGRARKVASVTEARLSPRSGDGDSQDTDISSVQGGGSKVVSDKEQLAAAMLLQL